MESILSATKFRGCSPAVKILIFLHQVAYCSCSTLLYLGLPKSLVVFLSIFFLDL